MKCKKCGEELKFGPPHKCKKADAESVRLDRVVKSRVVATTKPVEPYMVCPDCGGYPLRLEGRKTPAGYVDRKAICDLPCSNIILVSKKLKHFIEYDYRFPMLIALPSPILFWLISFYL